MKHLIKIIAVLLISLAAGLYISQRSTKEIVQKHETIFSKGKSLSEMIKKAPVRKTYVEEVPPPPLQLILLGTVLDSFPANSLAWIKDPVTGYEDYYKYSDRIKDAKIGKVESGRVELIRADGRREVFQIVEAKPGEKIIEAEKVITHYRNLNNILKEVSIGLEISGGKIKGVRLDKIKEQSIGDNLGFEEGDVIKEINGRPLSGLKEAAALYEYLKEEYAREMAKGIEVVFERNGKAEKRTYSVK